MKKTIKYIFAIIEYVILAMMYAFFAKSYVSYPDYLIYIAAALIAFVPIGIFVAVICVFCSFFYEIHYFVVNLSYLYIGVFLLDLWIRHLLKTDVDSEN